MDKIQVVTPGNLGPQFSLLGGKWQITGGGVSGDTGNLLSLGTDSAPLLTAEAVKLNQLTYTFTYDSVANELVLIDSDGARSNVPIQSLEASLDEVAVSGTQITFADKDSPNETLVVDFSTFLTAVARANTNAINISGDGTAGNPLTMDLVIDPNANNLLTVGVAGAMVDSNDILAILNANITNSISTSNNTITSTVNGVTDTATIVNSNVLAVNLTTDTIDSAVNGVTASLDAVELVDSNDVHIMYGIK